MVQRVERVAPTKAVEYDVGRPFEQRHGFSDSKGTGVFSEVLRQTMKKKQKKAAEAPVADPYVLDLSRATQSLFYRYGTSIEALRKKIHEG